MWKELYYILAPAIMIAITLYNVMQCVSPDTPSDKRLAYMMVALLYSITASIVTIGAILYFIRQTLQLYL